MRLFIASLPLAVVATAVCAPMSSITSTWNGGPSGNWNVAGNWSPSGVPNNGGGNTYDVVIDGNVGTASAVSLTNLSPAVATITIGGNDSLSVGNNLVFFLTGGSLSNAGLLTLNSTGNTTDFRIDLDTTFSGAGTFRGSNTQANRFYGASNAVRLTNATGHTIAGSMTLGVNQLRLTNAGVVDTDVSGGILLDLTDGAGLNFNSGTLRASNGAKLTLQNFTLDNTGGTIEAAAGSFVDLTGMSITGGTIRDADGAGPGVVRNTNSLTLTNVTLDGPFAQPNNTLVDLNGAIQMPSTYTVGSTGNTTDLRFNTSPFTLMGGGELLCTNTQANRIFGINNGVTLVVPADFWLHGSMQLGVNQMRLDNQSSIDADTSQGITVDLTDGAGINFNSGTLRASNGAKLTLQNFTLDNTGGMIEAAAGSFVDLTGMSISGGTIRDADGTGPGVVRNTNSLTLTNVILDGPFAQPNNTTVDLNGAIQMPSTYTLGSIGNLTDLRLFTSPFTFLGGGEIFCTNSQANRIFGINNGVTLVVPADFWLHGSMQLGVNQMRLDNQSSIDADSSQGITVDLTDGAGINFNSGTLRASNGAKLTLQNFTLDNTGGTIEAAAGSFVDLTGMSISGGTIRDADGTGPGVVRNTNTLTLTNVTLDGPFTQPNNTLVVLNGAMQFLSTYTVNSIGNTTDLRADTSPFTIQGGGEIVFSNSQSNRFYGVNGATRIVNAVGNTVRGSFQLGANQGAFTNHGAFIADASQGITIDVTDSQDFTTDGVLWASVGNITINPGPFFNGGAVLINAGRTISRAGAYTQTAGGTSVDGTLALSGGGTMQLQGGTLSGNGQVTGGLVNNTGGTVAPGSSAGLLSLGAGYTQAVNGALDVQIGGLVPGTQYDQLAVTGNASLAGTLRVSRINGFLPVPSDEFTILTTTGTRTGTFGIVESCDDVSVVYGTNFVKVKFTTSFGIPGDLNNDGVVDGADLGGLLAAWGPCIDPCCVADLNGDSTVDGGDLGILLANWS